MNKCQNSENYIIKYQILSDIDQLIWSHEVHPLFRLFRVGYWKIMTSV